MRFYNQLIVFIAVLFAAVLCSADENDPFDMTVEISEGDNAVNWESLIFADKVRKEEPATEKKDQENDTGNDKTGQTGKKVKKPKNTVHEEKPDTIPRLGILKRQNPKSCPDPVNRNTLRQTRSGGGITEKHLKSLKIRSVIRARKNPRRR